MHGSINIPATVTEIGEGAFANGTSLSIYYRGTSAPTWSTSLPSTVTLYCYAEIDPGTGNYWYDDNGTPTVWPRNA